MAGHAAKTLRPEDEVSHYRIVSPLGAGGMGEVYLAQDRTLERNVALKILPRDLVRSEERVRRFVLEAKSASSLSHPNIVTIYEIGQDAVRSPGEPPSDPVHFISMELVSGKTLTTLIHEDKTDLRSLLGYLAQAAEGLAKAHAAGIVHRDLKPGNIMVSADGFAKVLDFGLAKLTEKRDSGPDASSAPTQGPDATGAGVVLGTAGYMSPEQVQGKTVDQRSDIFSFGCILYEAVTRTRPFAAETGVETMHKILNEKPAPVEDLNPKAPAEIRRLIRRCLAKNPEQRFQSMKDLAIDLREIVDEFDGLSASASSGGSISGGSTAVMPAKQGPPVALIVGLVLLVAGGMAAGWWAMHRGKAASATQPFQNMSLSTVTSRGDVFDCALSNDGRYLAYICGVAGQTSLRVRQVATGSDVEVLPVSGAVIMTPSFSPDGNYLFYRLTKSDAQNYSLLNRVPSLGGTPEQMAFDVDTRATFSPDGKRVAFWRGAPQQQMGSLVVLDLDTHKERVLATVRNPENFSGGPSWSPDGMRIAAALVAFTDNFFTRIAMFDAATGKRVDATTIEKTGYNDVAWLRDGKGMVASGVDLRRTFQNQLWLLRSPGNVFERLTNDFNEYTAVSASGGDEAIGAVRSTRLQNAWIADAGSGEARQLTRAMNPENSTFSITGADTGTIVYSATQGQVVQVWRLSTSGNEPRVLTSGTAHSFNPRGVAGSVYFDRFDDTGVHVWRVGADGSDARQLTTGKGGEQISIVSPDGQFVLFTRLDAPRTRWLMSTADHQSAVFDANVEAIVGFSADSRRLLMGRSEVDAKGLVRVVWVARSVPDGAPVDSLRLPGEASNLAWSPLSDGVLFTTTAEGFRNLHHASFHGGAAAPITQFSDGRIMGYTVSPDRKRLAIVRLLGKDQNLWIADAEGGHPIQVTHLSGQEIPEIRWMPDSRRVLFGVGTASSDVVLVRGFR